MPDFRGHVRKHLPPLDASGARQAEIVEELAIELEERYKRAIAGGVSPEQAWEQIGADPAVLGGTRRSDDNGFGSSQAQPVLGIER